MGLTKEEKIDALTVVLDSLRQKVEFQEGVTKCYDPRTIWHEFTDMVCGYSLCDIVFDSTLNEVEKKYVKGELIEYHKSVDYYFKTSNEFTGMERREKEIGDVVQYAHYWHPKNWELREEFLLNKIEELS
jgi:hypothetical protein